MCIFVTLKCFSTHYRELDDVISADLDDEVGF